MNKSPTQTHVKPLFIRRNQLREIAGISSSTAWRLEQDGNFPKRRRIAGSSNCVGWLYSEIEEWLNNCEQIV
jgi:prophage regulatory protein